MATAFLIGLDLVLTCYVTMKELIEMSYYENPVTRDRTALTPEGEALRFDFTRDSDG